MTLNELRDKRNKLLHDVQAISLSATDEKPLTAEQRTSMNAMLADVDVLEADISVVERTNKALAETRQQAAPPRGNPGAEMNDPDAIKAEQRKALSDYVLRGVMSPALESRAGITTGTSSSGGIGTGGGAIVPQAFDMLLHEAQLAWGDLVNIVRVVRSDNGAPQKYATVNDTSVTWYEETENVADSNSAENPTFTGALLSTSVIQRPAILVSFAEMQDSAFDIDSFMKNTIGKSFFRGLSTMIVNGSSSGNVASILGIASGAKVAAATAATIAYADVANLYAALDPAYEATSSFVLNSTTRGYLIGQTDTLGRPLYVPSPNAGAFDTLLGRPVKIVQAMPNIPSATSSGVLPLMYGDFSEGYTLKLVNPGLNILRLSERYADSLSVGFVPFFRAGGVITDAGTHPIVGLKVTHS